MKTKILILIALFISVSVVAQKGYKYKSNFIEFKEDKSALFIQTSKDKADERNAELGKLIKTKNTPNFIKISQNSFVIFDSNYKSKEEDYT